MRYWAILFWAFSVSAQTVVITDPSQFRHRTRLFDFESNAAGEPLRFHDVVSGTEWFGQGVHFRSPDHHRDQNFQVMHSRSDPLGSVHSGQLSLWQWRAGFHLITFPGVNLPVRKNAILRRLSRAPGAARGYTREVGLWVINGSFKRRAIVAPHPTRGAVTFYDRWGSVITNIVTGTTNTFVGLRHRAGIGAVVFEHSTTYPVIDDVYVGRIFRTRDLMFDTVDFYSRQ